MLHEQQIMNKYCQMLQDLTLHRAAILLSQLLNISTMLLLLINNTAAILHFNWLLAADVISLPAIHIENISSAAAAAPITQQPSYTSPSVMHIRGSSAGDCKYTSQQPLTARR